MWQRISHDGTMNGETTVALTNVVDTQHVRSFSASILDNIYVSINFTSMYTVTTGDHTEARG